MKTKEEIKKFVLDTLLPYKEDPKTCATDDNNSCLYLTDDGRKCAVGKHMKEGGHQSSLSNVYDLNVQYGLENILTKEALSYNLSLHAWSLMQSYHDDTARDNSSRFHFCNITLKELEGELGIELNELKY